MSGLKDYLLSRGLTFTDEWLDACSAWVKDSFSTEGPVTEDILRAQVYEQWLDVNLQELESECLPRGLAQERLKVLTGQYGLQINSLRDIGESAYNQYNKIKKLENENTSVSASNNDEFKFSWQPKVRRCLQLTLTDGTQEIFGMELVQIPALHLDMKPGTKVVVSGPIECRRGILHLKPNHVKILGGDVEGLSVKNSVENVLSRALNDTKRSGNSETQPSTVSVISRETPASQRNLHDRTTQVISTQELSQALTQPISTAPIPSPAPAWATNDGFEDDDDIFMEIDEEALLQSVSGTQTSRSTTVERPKPAKQRITAKAKKFVPPPSESQTDTQSQGQPIPAASSKSRKPSGDSNKQQKISSYLKPVPSKIAPSKAPRSSVISTTDEDIDIVDLEDDGAMSDSGIPVEPIKAKTNMKGNKGNISSKINVSELPDKPTPITKSPYQYIRQINNGLFKAGDIISVRGIVATLTSNITVDKSSGEWKLSVNVNDGSGYLIARIAPQVLQSIIGFSPAQMKQMKSSKSTNGKQKVMEGMTNLTSMLVHFNGIIGIRITDQPEQVIVGLTEITSQNVCALVCRTTLDEL